jgi:endonuclease YncB( thermonuclease family)
LWPQGLAAATVTVVDGLGIVRDDGTLSVGGHPVRLFGIIIPQTRRTCRSFLNPPRCAPSVVLVLENKVTGFVRCEIVRQGRDGIPEGVCGVRGRDLFAPREDLAGWMLQQGFALAGPEAPPEYFALERLAQSQQVGLWNPGIVNIR